MNSKKEKMLKDLERNNSISLKMFLVSFCGVRNQSILSNKISHNDIKKLMPDIKRVSFDYVLRNIPEIYTGNVILVKDSFGHMAPYVKPEIINYDDEFYFDDSVVEKKEYNFEKAIELENLNNYQLKELKDKYKELGRITEYRKICRIIRMRKEKLKQYHFDREELKLKGRIDND